VRSRLGIAGLAVLVLVAWTLSRRGPAPVAVPAPIPRPAASAAGLSSPTPAVEVRRNPFRFAEEPSAGRAPLSAGASPRHVEPSPAPSPSPGPRLVGFVRRGGRIVAALSGPDGEVELAGPGEMAAGVVVVEIGTDSVRIRRPDGTEATLTSP
jgi:hypothetical protein